MNPLMQISEVSVKVCFVGSPRQSINTGGGITLEREERPSRGPHPARALDRGAGRFLFDLIDGSERWGDLGALASRRFPAVLALEIPPPGRSAASRSRAAGAHPTDQRGQSAMGCAAYPWRAAQARLWGRSIQRR
jgi:hypothetical protein